MADVFISYSSEDKKRTEQLVAELEKSGISCWIDRNNIATGSYFAEEVPEAILDCPIFMLLLSENSQKSKYVLMELDWATSHDKDIIPVVISDCAIIPKFGFLLQNKQRYRAFDGSRMSIHKMITQIKTLLSNTDCSLTCDRNTVELAQRHGIKCPACGASDYSETFDLLESAVRNEASKNETRSLSVMMFTLFAVLIAISIMFEGMAIIIDDAIPALELKQMELLNDEVFASRLEGAIFTFGVFHRIFFTCSLIFAILGVIVFPFAMIYAFPEDFCKYRTNRRKQKHIEVCKLKCSVCEKHFKKVIKLDQNALKGT